MSRRKGEVTAAEWEDFLDRVEELYTGQQVITQTNFRASVDRIATERMYLPFATPAPAGWVAKPRDGDGAHFGKGWNPRYVLAPLA